jgi:hypothetical protein
MKSFDFQPIRNAVAAYQQSGANLVTALQTLHSRLIASKSKIATATPSPTPIVTSTHPTAETELTSVKAQLAKALADIEASKAIK